MRSLVAVTVLLLATSAFATSTQDQIIALIQSGTKAHDAIDTVFDLLNDLKQQNVDAQYAANQKNETDEFIGQSTIEKFTEIMNLNKKLYVQAGENRANFEAQLQDTKNYIAWNEARRDEIVRKSEVLLDNQCYSNQLFVRSIKQNQEALEVVRLLKQDVAGYVTAGNSFEFTEIPKDHLQSISEKLKMYSHLFSEHEVNAFLELADKQDEEEGEEEKPKKSGRAGTVAERVLGILQDLEDNLAASLTNLETNEINAAWELASWLASSHAEVEFLAVEHERAGVRADRLATQIQATLAQQAKCKAILQESQDALNSAMSDLENKRDSYAQEKAKRDEENAILDEVITMFKNQVASWSGR